MSEKKTTEMNELLEEANDMSLGEEAGGAVSILPSLATKVLRWGAVYTISADCNLSRVSFGIIRR